jgi:subtilisin family serine protease
VRSASAKKPVKAKVGLVDAGIDAKHPMLKQVVVNTRSFDPLTNARGDSHGTAVASLIAGVSPGATVFAANVFTTSADGQEIATADAIVRGLDWLASMHVAVINLSLTGPANPILEAMIGRLNAAGHVLVAAVGNEGPRGAPQFPAAYDKVVGVTAVDGKNRVYLYANQGEYVDFAAHGVDLRVADPRGTVNTVSGTSYAAPVVAARLAAYLEVPDVALAAKAVEALAAEARDLGAPGRDPVFGHGLIGD